MDIRAQHSIENLIYYYTAHRFSRAKPFHLTKDPSPSIGENITRLHWKSPPDTVNLIYKLLLRHNWPAQG